MDYETRLRTTATTRLSTHELNMFLITVEQAADLARHGLVADGYEALLRGLHRARGIADDGAEWAEELVTRYREAVERYAERYGVGRA